MKKEKHSMQQHIIRQLDLPRDLFCGSPILTMTGEGELLIENHRGLISCNMEQIVVRSKKRTIRIRGRGMTVDSFSPEDMKISGCITEIGFLYAAE